MTVPPNFVGAWERVTFELAGKPVELPARTIWLQGHSAYCDLRMPPAGSDQPVESFAGHCTLVGDELHFTHDLDLAGGPAALADIGTVAWDNGDLVETGVFLIDGATTPYREVWRRLDWAANPVLECTDTGFAHVRVGVHAITIEDRRPTLEFSACYRRDGVVEMAIGLVTPLHPVLT